MMLLLQLKIVILMMVIRSVKVKAA
jgi:hypothetical protein